MINLLIGPPGGGKSYEAVVYHVLPALNSGRKVITNLPLNLDRLAMLGFDTSLVDIRTKTLAVEPVKDLDKAETLYKKFGIASREQYFVNRPFAHPEDYGDTWRHADNGAGPLYVIDECHLALPARDTKRAVEEWFSLHRHESADVLLITQSYGKVSKSIVDLVQVCYRVKKGTAFGTATQYIRKVQDGVRGEVVNTAVRKYEKRYFGLYQSHTRGGGSELAANDIVPLWKRWPFLGAALLIPLALGWMIYSGAYNPLALSKPKSQPSITVETFSGLEPSSTLVKTPVSSPVPKEEKTESEPDHPYFGHSLHVIGRMVSEKTGISVFFAVAQNGQRVSDVSSGDLEKIGYKVSSVVPCTARIQYGNWSKWIVCDAPALSINPGGKSPSSDSGSQTDA